MLGSGERLESTVIGDAVNIASRLEQLTKDHGVDAIASAQVLEGAGVEGIRLGTVPIRGREQPLEIYGIGA